MVARRITTLFIAAGLLVSAAGAALAAPARGAGTSGVPAQTRAFSRFDDGSFEYPLAPVNSFTTYSTGQLMGPWTVTSGAVDLIGEGFWQAAEGDQSVDLNATVPGAVAQTFTTTPGATYTVTYALAANAAGGPTLKTGRVLVDGQVFQDFSFDITGKTYTDMGYVNRQFTFVATSGTTTLTFASTTAGSAYGPVIDDVRVTSCSSSCSCSC
ncbi:choice-of-anchor C family protein [Allostreptomyces psammosilenae]|uniref:Choice-of-anchor C domain-containing protein n=1 Tax=Allostreptomyces psammosilenae TaxID=1892865 RepID=A0A852ZTP0_9ACTN|nr:choice-of-anchor C family protein [Allostreptomyces psammosilenae]NYI04650.1 choice-of-anchor C domain-containing protein [Allostreptomyces psammosilenae]